MRKWIFNLILVVLLFCCGGSIHAQDCDNICPPNANNCRIDDNGINYDAARWRIEIAFLKTLKKEDLKNAPAQTWVLVDILEASVERPINVIQPPQRGDDRPEEADEPFDTVFLYLNQPLKENHEYRLFQSKLTFEGCKPQVLLETKIKVAPTTPAPVPGTSPTPKPKTNYFAKSESKGREDSNVYLSGLIEGARKSKTQISADVKLDIPIATTRFFEEIGPFFNLKASTADDADANSINFGLKLRHSFIFSRKADSETHQFICDPKDRDPKTKECKDKRLLTGLVFDLLPGFETERRGRNVNSLLAGRLYFLPRATGGANLFYLQPFIGYEIGGNIKSPVVEAKNRTVSRSLIGSSLYVHLPQLNKGLSFQADYVRRFLVNREISFKANDDGKLVPLFLGKGPRDYLKAGFTFAFSDFTGATINYEYGRLPPNFQLVGSKFSFGLVYKFKTTYPSK